MSSFGKKVSSPDKRKMVRRRRVDTPASAITLQGAKAVLIEDVSPSGARLVGRNLPHPGAEMLIRTTELTALAHVRWTNINQCGIVFAEGAPNTGECLAMHLRARLPR